jgi:hypothetical protein
VREIRFLCLAVSRRDGGNCIAGIDLDSRAWIRPVNCKSTGAFSDHELIAIESCTGKKRFLAPLDVIPLNLENYAGSNAQPENWAIQPSSYETPFAVISRFDRDTCRAELSSFLDKTDRLLHSYGNSVSESDAKLKPFSHSLSLVRPNQLFWKVAEGSYAGKLQVRAEFRFGQIPYSLVVTDVDWEARVRPLGAGRYAHSRIERAAGDVFLTISLAAVPMHGYHYKLVAGVINVPA